MGRSKAAHHFRQPLTPAAIFVNIRSGTSSRKQTNLTLIATPKRKKVLEHLWGFCKTCEYAKLCRGGCSWTAHSFFGRRGNNPYCHHRALKQHQNGKRERFVLKRQAKGLPFDHGEFDLIEESASTGPGPSDEFDFNVTKIMWTKQGA